MGPTKNELCVFILIAGSITILLTITDIVIFDHYVLPIISECHPQNNSTLCQDLRESMNLKPNTQLELGSQYWAVLNANFWVLGAVMFGIRALTARLFRGMIKGRKWHEIYIIMGAVWFFGTIVWFLFGWLDSGYYVLRLDMIPDKLDWLNNVGLFYFAQHFTGDSLTVEFWDVILLNLIGLGVFVFIWILAFKINKILEKEG